MKNNKLSLLYKPDAAVQLMLHPVDVAALFVTNKISTLFVLMGMSIIFKLVLSVKHSILFFLLVMSPGMGWLPQVVPNKVVPSPSLEIIREGGKAEGQNRQQNRILRNYLIVM